MLAAVPLVLVQMDQQTHLILCKFPPQAVEVQGRVQTRQFPGAVATLETDPLLEAVLLVDTRLLSLVALVASLVLQTRQTEPLFLTPSAVSVVVVVDMQPTRSDNLVETDLPQEVAAVAAPGLIMGSTAALVEMAAMEP